MKKLLVFLVVFGALASPAWAEQLLVENAQVSAIRMYGRSFETEAALIFINKLPEECQVLWLPTANNQGNRSYSLALLALEKQLAADFLVEPDSNVPNYAGRGKACEILYLQVGGS
jgi:hypothetical protein